MRFERLDSREEVRQVIERINCERHAVAVDTETTGLSWREDRLLSVVVGAEDRSYSFAPEHAHLLLDLTPTLIFQNFKFDYHMLCAAGVDLRGKPMRDIMLIEHLLDENAEHSLGAMVERHFSDYYKKLFWERYKSMDQAPELERLAYEGKDAIYTGRLYWKFMAELERQGIPLSLVEHVHRLALALWDTEHFGVKCDLPFTIQMGTELKADIVRTESELRRLGGWDCEVLELERWRREIEKCYTPKGKKWQTLPKPVFNFNASGQVCELLYDRLKLPPQFNKKTKQRTADDKALERLGDAHPILPEIRKHRKLSKMYGTFVEGVLEKVVDGRIFPSFNVNGTVTGRISHSEPNMGQMPSRGDWVKIRGIFVPSPGRKLITCDYGMLEVVIAAHFSQDKNLLRIIREGASKHDITAEGVGLPRSVAKTLNFAMQYQCSPNKVRDIVGCSEKEAQAIWNKYWETYAGEKAVIDRCNSAVDRGEPIITPFGRKRRFPSRFDQPWERAAAHRQAYSSLIQGTGADITSTAFYRIAEHFKAQGWGRGWFTVHDEILAEVEEARVEEAREYIQQTMVGIGPEIGLTVPLTVDCSDGLDRWEK